MQDLISRQAAIDAFLTELTKRERTSLLHTWSTVEVKYFIAKILEQLPSAQPGWIPCTPETMPKNKSNVLTVIYIPGRQAHIRSGWYEDGLFMNDNGDTWKATDKEVVGWMYQPKLPNPREGGQDGKN